MRKPAFLKKSFKSFIAAVLTAVLLMPGLFVPAAAEETVSSSSSAYSSSSEVLSDSTSSVSTSEGENTNTDVSSSSDTDAPETDDPSVQAVSGPDTDGSEEPSPDEEAEDPAEDTGVPEDAEAEEELLLEEPEDARELTPEELEELEEEITNEELIAMQNLVHVPEIVFKEDFRFYRIDKIEGFAKEDLEIYEEMSENSRPAGTLEKEGVLYILSEEKDGWMYVESGWVRGFVKKERIILDKEAQKLSAVKKARIQVGSVVFPFLSKRFHKEYPVYAKHILTAAENGAFRYKLCTTKDLVIDKEYALVNADALNIREEKNTDSRIVGKAKKGTLLYIIADKDKDWVFVESADVRGFVAKEYIDFGEDIQKKVGDAGENRFARASEKIGFKDNRATYYTYTSVREGQPWSDTVRAEILKTAASCIGNPYVWGGTSLTSGCDCSGFVQSVYKMYGITLPRTSCYQAQYGTQIPLSDAAPGDLIFFATKGRVYHVAIYAGDGRTIEAKSEQKGICAGVVSGRDAVWATRVITD